MNSYRNSYVGNNERDMPTGIHILFVPLKKRDTKMCVINLLQEFTHVTSRSNEFCFTVQYNAKKLFRAVSDGLDWMNTSIENRFCLHRKKIKRDKPLNPVIGGKIIYISNHANTSKT